MAVPALQRAQPPPANGVTGREVSARALQGRSARTKPLRNALVRSRIDWVVPKGRRSWLQDDATFAEPEGPSRKSIHTWCNHPLSLSTKMPIWKRALFGAIGAIAPEVLLFYSKRSTMPGVTFSIAQYVAATVLYLGLAAMVAAIFPYRGRTTP